MKKQIDNFTFNDTKNKVAVDYKLTTKDKFDIILTFTIGVTLSVATFYLLKQGFKTTSYIVIAGGLIFAFQAVIQLISALSRFFQPTKNLLVIDKNTKTLISKSNPLTSKIISLHDIETIIISGQNEKLFFGSKNRMTRTYCTVTAKVRNKSDERLFTINSNRFLRPSSQKVETELYSKAKRLTLELNNHLKSKYKWSGYNDV